MFAFSSFNLPTCGWKLTLNCFQVWSKSSNNCYMFSALLSKTFVLYIICRNEPRSESSFTYMGSHYLCQTCLGRGLCIENFLRGLIPLRTPINCHGSMSIICSCCWQICFLTELVDTTSPVKNCPDLTCLPFLCTWKYSLGWKRKQNGCMEHSSRLFLFLV